MGLCELWGWLCLGGGDRMFRTPIPTIDTHTYIYTTMQSTLPYFMRSITLCALKLETPMLRASPLAHTPSMPIVGSCGVVVM